MLLRVPKLERREVVLHYQRTLPNNYGPPVIPFRKHIAAYNPLLLLTWVFAQSATAQVGQVAPWNSMPCVERIPHFTMPNKPPWKEQWPPQVLGSSNCNEVKRGAFGVGASCICIDQIGIDARTGCCPHHRGVCACKDHAVMCCDGTESPTCTCHE